MTERMSNKVKLDQIKFDRHNANKGSVRGRGQIEASLREFGFADAGTLDKNNTIIGGNKRTEVAGEIGMDEAIIVDVDGTKPVFIRRKDLDLNSTEDDRARRLAYALNRSQEVSLTWDAEVLLADLQSGVDLSGMFNSEELDALLDGLVEKAPVQDVGAQVDKAAELQAKWGTATGQLWSMGKHRLICGDCTDKATVERLMMGERAQLCFTSPPYNLGENVSISNRSENLKQGGSAYIDYADQKTTGDYLSLLNGFLALSLSFCDYTFVNVQMLAGNKQALIMFLYQWISHFVDVAVWTKSNPQPAMAENVMNSAFEFVLMFSKNENPTRAISTGNFRGTVSNVYSSSVNRSVDTESHGAGFPVDFVSFYLQNFSGANNAIYEPFAGSGTTLIACESLNRRCFASEISPAYCAVILQRFADSTGQTPVLIDSSTVIEQ